MKMTENKDHRLVPPDAGLKRDEQKKQPSLLVIFLTLFLFFDVAILIFWLLPAKGSKSSVRQKTVQAEAPAASTIAPEPPLAARESITAKARLAAENQLDHWLRLQAGNNAENINLWGGEEYTQITDLVSRGDKAMADRKFVRARQIYGQASERLQALLAAKEEMFYTVMEEGYAALDRQDSTMAVQKFKLAISMEPDSEDARHGLQRAGNLEQVVLLYHQGLELEKKDCLTAARPLLQQATRLDPEFIPAAETLARIETKLRDRKFQLAMSDFFTALHNSDFKQARRSLHTAAAIKPADPVLRNAETQLTTTVTASRLSTLEKKFSRLTAAEQWQKAMHVCEQAQQIDPDVGFAVQNIAFVGQRAKLDRKINRILSQPQRLQDNGPLTEAREVLEMARSFRNPGPELKARIVSLDRLIVTASTEVEVSLRSDGATEVVIYRVGRLGTFKQKQLKLRPGTYTVVGSRPGFRDVRRKLTVSVKRKPSLFICCEEPI